jgi:hypothetical protein
VFLIIDALDECEITEQDRFLEFIQQLLDWRVGGLHLLVTSRPEVHIVKVMEKLCSESEVVDLNSENVASDIKYYVRSEIYNPHSPGFARWPKDIKEQVIESLVINAGGM